MGRDARNTHLLQSRLGSDLLWIGLTIDRSDASHLLVEALSLIQWVSKFGKGVGVLPSC